ncbi:hypothetical protein [Rathayibacter sp. Leaf248]|uniref:hypothetical protein n=1 Tax=Rathayibacter sp. Leaf248 TaxID=2876555 RepID=UPI001E2C222B|nr:hypothetical protein [Rathayibacter sp. Leaf248]
MQDEDDERRDLERALFARPSGDAEGESRRIDAERRLRLEQDAVRAEAAVVAPEAPRLAPVAASEAPAASAPRRRRPALIVGGALAAGLVLGAVAASVAPQVVGASAPTASPTATVRPENRFAAYVDGWTLVTDPPAGMDLIAGPAEVFTPGFDTVQEDRILLTAPNGTSLCLGLERVDGSLSAGCTGLAEFFDSGSLDIVGTDVEDGSGVYSRVTMRPDGSIEGGYQLLTRDPSEP